MEKVKVDKSTKQQETERSSAIMLAVEMETTMKLYSYRIISHEQFFERVKELTAVFNYSISQKAKHEKNERQLDILEEIEKTNY